MTTRTVHRQNATIDTETDNMESSDTEFRIIGFQMGNHWKRSNGDRPLAKFNVRISGIDIVDCTLIEKRKGGHFVEGARDKHKAVVHFRNTDLADRIMDSALEWLSQFEGTE